MGILFALNKKNYYIFKLYYFEYQALLNCAQIIAVGSLITGMMLEMTDKHSSQWSESQ